MKNKTPLSKNRISSYISVDGVDWLMVKMGRVIPEGQFTSEPAAWNTSLVKLVPSLPAATLVMNTLINQ